MLAFQVYAVVLNLFSVHVPSKLICFLSNNDAFLMENLIFPQVVTINIGAFVLLFLT